METVSAMRNVVCMGLAQKDSGKLVRLWRDLVGPDARLGSHGVVHGKKTTLNPLTPEEAGCEWEGTVPLYSQCCTHSPAWRQELWRKAGLDSFMQPAVSSFIREEA